MSHAAPVPLRAGGDKVASLSAARAVVAALIDQGVRDAVLCPGSRSAPLAYALAEAEEDAGLRLRVVLDERSAGFVALGAAKAHALAGRCQPAVVVTTSGTAVANLHPAVLEADAAGIPMLVLSADRPHELVGTGANQTTEQTLIFGRAPRAVIDLPADLTSDLPRLDAAAALTGQIRRAVLATTGELNRDPGPAHVNIRFRPPLVPLGAPAPRGDGQPGRTGAAAPRRSAPVPEETGRADLAPGGGAAHAEDAAGTHRATASETSPGPPGGAGGAGIVVVGDAPQPGVGALGRALAEYLGWPLMAEPSSGARAGGHALTRYAEVLSSPAGEELAAQVHHVLVVGHPSLTRAVSGLLARPDLRIDVLADRSRHTDVAGTAAGVHPLDTATGAPELARALGAQRAGPEWLAAWHDAVAALPRDAGSGADLAALAVWEAACAPDAPLLVLGSSLTIRRLDRLAPPGVLPPAVVANRGLAGIDGTLGTATGLALASGRPVRAVVGDLTFLHDAMSLGRGRLEDEPDLQVVVLDDGGGAIFSELEYAAVPGAARFERFFATPQAVRIADLARGLGARVVEPDDLETLRTVLAEPVRGLSVVHIVVEAQGPGRDGE